MAHLRRLSNPLISVVTEVMVREYSLRPHEDHKVESDADREMMLLLDEQIAVIGVGFFPTDRGLPWLAEFLQQAIVVATLQVLPDGQTISRWVCQHEGQYVVLEQRG